MYVGYFVAGIARTVYEYDFPLRDGSVTGVSVRLPVSGSADDSYLIMLMVYWERTIYYN